MTNKKTLTGMLVMALVFGMMVVGCDSNGGTEKTIQITGISGEYLTATDYMIFVHGADDKVVAQADNGQLSGSTVTFDLYNITFNSNGSWHTTSDRWTGSGTFRRVEWGVTIGGNWKTINAWDIKIDKAVTTIPFSQFNLNQ